MKSFVADIPEKIVFGAGCVDTVGKYAKPLGRRAAIIAGKGVRPEKTALLDKIRALLGGQGVESFVYAEINENPLIPVVDAGVKFARENSCDLVIGVGGGSSLDSAKIIAMVLSLIHILAGKHVIRRPDRHLAPVDGIDRICAREYARLFARG